MRTSSCSPARVIASAAWLIAALSAVVAWPSNAEAGDSWKCPGHPEICQESCSLDQYGVPLFCEGGICICAAGYDTVSGAGGSITCTPHQPDFMPSFSDVAFCPDKCAALADDVCTTSGQPIPISECTGPGGCVACASFCPDACTQDPWGAATSTVNRPFDLIPVHGTAPGGEAFMPVWGQQANNCGAQGVSTARCFGGSKDGGSCNTPADCPGGTCTLVGACQGGSNNGGACFGNADCTGTCGPLSGHCGNANGHSCTTVLDCNPAGGPFDVQCVYTGTCSGAGGVCKTDADCAGWCGAIGRCSIDGRTCTTNDDCDGGTCDPVRSWNGCAADAHSFCVGIQESDEAAWSPPRCSSNDGCRDSNPANFCTSDFTSAWPYLEQSDICKILSSLGQLKGQTDPSRMDFPNNVIVYRAPIAWENHGDEDDDYTWNMHSPGHELYDTDTQYQYQGQGGRIHIEFDSDETIDHFAKDKHDWGPANQWWRDLHNTVDNSNGSDDQKDFNVRCYVKSFVNPQIFCPLNDGVDPGAVSTLHDPMAVVIGAPSLDCADNDQFGTDEIHPAYAMAIRIQEDPSRPEQWTFFYHRKGNDGPCGQEHFGRCGTTFKLPLGLPVIPENKVLTSADVVVDWHAWSGDGDPSSGVDVAKSFDLLKGTVLTITLPGEQDGVVGLVTVTPHLDTTPPTITCPTNISTMPDLGKCTASAMFSPTIGDNCSVSATCSPPSGSAFPIGTTSDTCTATDQAGLQTSCSFSVTTTVGNKCPHDHGYWKNHTNWPVTSLMLGTTTYTQAQLLGILKSPTSGDASVILARAEIAALLSQANGSDPSAMCGTVADADAALGNLLVPANISPKTVLGQRMIHDADSLASYDNGALTPGCAP